MKVVLDTVVLVRSLINPRGLWGELIFLHAQEYSLIVSAPILVEYLDVLSRPELTRKFRTLRTMDVSTVLTYVQGAEIVELEDVPSFSRDPKDDKFLATAAAASADYVVSEDRDLLDLQVHGAVRIVTAKEFLQVLTGLDE